MSYRNQLPQALDRAGLTDDGLEVVMIYQERLRHTPKPVNHNKQSHEPKP